MITKLQFDQLMMHIDLCVYSYGNGPVLHENDARVMKDRALLRELMCREEKHVNIEMTCNTAKDFAAGGVYNVHNEIIVDPKGEHIEPPDAEPPEVVFKEYDKGEHIDFLLNELDELLDGEGMRDWVTCVIVASQIIGPDEKDSPYPVGSLLYGPRKQKIYLDWLMSLKSYVLKSGDKAFAESLSRSGRKDRE